jgi:DNA-binding MarR family transcriptional regulator
MSATHGALIDQAMQELDLLVAYRRRNMCEREFTRDLSLAQFHVLLWLNQHGPQTLSDLAHALHISAPSASSLVDRLEDAGYVTRERDRQDRRVVHVGISEAGKAAAEEMMGVKRDHMREVLGVMTEDELRTVLAFIDTLRSAIGRLEAATTQQAS